MRQPQPNEVRREFLSTLGLNPFKPNTSASRDQMVSNHLGQRLTVEGANPRYIQTGMENEYGKYTFAKRMPVNGHVIKRIERYERTFDENRIAFSPQTILLYEDDEEKEVGVMDLPNFSTQHPYFGFEYRKGPAWGKMVEGDPIGEGQVFLDTPAIDAEGNYSLGVQCNVAYMSHPAVSEDGILIRKGALNKFAFKTYETRVIELGSKSFPLNTYGTPGNYKAFPDIGDELRPDGLLMALRTYDELLAPVEQGMHDVCEIDHFFDQTIYAGAGGRVVDIRVHRQTSNPNPTTPEAMEKQLLKYDKARKIFYQGILDEYNRLKRSRQEALKITPQFRALVREAINVVGHNTTAPNEPIKQLYRQAPLDEWRIEFVIEYRIVPKDGAKLTDFHGGKGVICQIAEDHEMPVDAHGNVADIVMDGGATVSRMNIGRLYEHYFNAASRDLVRELTLKLNVNPTDRHLHARLQELNQQNPELIEAAWERLMGFYRIINVEQEAMYRTDYPGEPVDHLYHVIKDRICYLYHPPETQNEPLESVRQIEQHYKPLYGPVTYIGNSGRRVTTVNPVRIGSVYIMLLEKIADDWSAVSSGKLQHFGVLSQLTASDKYSKPTRQQAIRAMGESEVRIYVSYCGTRITADLLDRNNNPFTHKHILENIMRSQKPTAIKSIIDRKQFPLGGSKPLQLTRHIAQCGGWRFVYEKPTPI